MNTWMTSKEGREQYKLIKKRLCQPESGNDIELYLLALLYYGQVLDRTERIATPAHGSFLGDFIYHLNDDSGDIQRAMWESMALSFRRVATVGAGIAQFVLAWLETVELDTVGRKLPDSPAGCIADGFWQSRLLGHPHEATCEWMQRGVRELLYAGGALLDYLNKGEERLGNEL